MVNKSSSIPLYVQVKDILEKEIQSGSYEPGDKLPTEKELTKRFDISRMTLRQATNALVEEGFLKRLKGVGTIVQERKLEQSLTTLKSFTEDIMERGMKPSSKVLSFQKQKGTFESIEKMGIQLKDDMWVTKRIRYADENPIAVETNIIPVHLLPELTEQDMERSLHECIKNSGYTMGKASTSIEASMPSESERKHLDIQEISPVLIVERVTYLDDGRPIEWSISVNRSDRYRFSAELLAQPRSHSSNSNTSNNN
ncbi:GntR family transcriptional regulator [Salipaludibacillus daqingensis]|uniref:GntR family transcriptional regulator n=1 Tax=Salipaludibacillus daqingensis TaxID=3041001 RepID=UPI0024768268|nr:GntR family transcriptional regulator [Salipaludibacillus daqingensis]